MAPRKTAKKMSGKSAAKQSARTDTYKPSLYLHGTNIPDHLKSVKPGEKVSITLQGTITHRSEDPKGVSSVEFEIGKIEPEKAGKK